jgi:tetratricopeptide (TPR) repeat protein
MYGYDQRAVENLAKKIMQSALKESERMLRADKEFEKGNVAVAYRLYASVASARPATEQSSTAKTRMKTVREKGQQQCDEIDERLKDLVNRLNNVSAPEDAPEKPNEEFERIFQDYKQLLKQYQQVSPFGSWLVKHVAQQRVRPECAAALNEPKAAELWKLGQIHEENDQLCCAYRTYEKAEKLLPAPSAVSAQGRLKTMKEDPKIVEAAKTCAELEWCHRTYQRAEKLRENNPERARELFSQVVERSPADSSVHRAAQEQLQERK